MTFRSHRKPRGSTDDKVNDFETVNHCNCTSISCRFRNMKVIERKSPTFHTHPVFEPPFGGDPTQIFFRKQITSQKNGMMGVFAAVKEF